MLRSCLAFSLAVATVALSVGSPADAQIPTSPGQKLAPTNNSEQHLSDLTVESANAITAARAAAGRCDAKGLADAIQTLKDLEQESRNAAAAARLSGTMSLVRTDFADSIHSTIAGELKNATALKLNCPQNQPKPAQAGPKQPNPPPPPPPKPVQAQPGGFAGGPPLDPWTELKLEAWDLFEDLDYAIWDCDADEIKKLIPELQALLDRARMVEKTAKAAGQFSKVKPGDAADLVDSIEDALDAAKSFKGCPLPKETQKPSNTKPEKPSQPKPGKSTLDDLFKPQTPAQPKNGTEQPKPPEHSIIDDLREPATPFELHAIQDRVKELSGLTKDYPKLLEGCHPDIWDKHIAHLEDLAKRARQMADDVKRGYTKGVSQSEADSLANEAQKAVDEARSAKAADLQKWKVPECPKSSTPPKTEKTGAMRTPEPSPYQNVSVENPNGPVQYVGALSPNAPAEARNAKEEYDSIYNSLSGLMLGFFFKGESGGCDLHDMQTYVTYLEGLDRRAHALAEAVKEAGAYSEVEPARALKLAEHIQRHIDEAKEVVSVDCPAGVRFKINPYDSKILTILNRERMAVGVEPLHWDPALAGHAAAYLPQLVQTGQPVHASREGRGRERENIGQGRRGSTPDQIVERQWMGEKADFYAGYFPNVARDGFWVHVGHYTQDISPENTDVGCASTSAGEWVWVDCRFAPGGNKDNEPVGYRDPLTYTGGPLVFDPRYLPELKRMQTVNPDRLEFGDEAVSEWNKFEDARGRRDVPGMTAAIEKLKYYAQAAHEHSAEEHLKGNELASGSYNAMAKQIDERVADASLYRDAFARNPYYAPERG